MLLVAGAAPPLGGDDGEDRDDYDNDHDNDHNRVHAADVFPGPSVGKPSSAGSAVSA